jgi:uncharacterized protein YjbI with pentapeptide repeats/uncharacterized membrane-anchored protein YhcB (DUF1043 family)
MDSAVLAAYIAAGASLVTLAGTTISQRLTSGATSQDNEKTLQQQRDQSAKTLQQQRDQLDQTLAEQRHELDKTLAEQGKQLNRTLGEQRTRTLNERFATAADRLGSDKTPAVRLAGVYAMAGLADDWKENRQTCVDVLCAYLRMPYQPDPGKQAHERERLDFRASSEVRHTVIRVITAHLRDGAAKSWRGLNLDFTGVVFDEGDFMGATFHAADTISFRSATFCGDMGFRGATFSGGTVDFEGATFSGGTANFSGATFSGGAVNFSNATFSEGDLWFGGATFCGGTVNFNGATFSGSTVDFPSATFSGGTVDFSGAIFSRGTISFLGTRFCGSEVLFFGTQFCGSEVQFTTADFSDGMVSFANATFSDGTVDFSSAGDWSHPPEFDWEGTPPPGVKLPQRQDQSPPLTS